MLAEKLPELLDFPKDLVSLEASTKVLFLQFFRSCVVLTNFQCCFEVNRLVIMQIQLKYLAEEMQAISKGLEKVVQELANSENDGHVSENFCQVNSSS